jgi:EAL domain-containing protein (putative c-di-GMP-specific phosphodiesterase class I)
MNRATTLPAAAAHLADWYLKECGEDQAEARQCSLRAFPFTINRLPEASLQINHGSISKRHAEIASDDSRLFVEDCGSTNGTFVNGKRLAGRIELRDGDLLQFANFVFRLGRHEAHSHEGTLEESVLPWAQTLLQFERLMSDKAVSPHFQPIVRLADSHVVGFELLARSTLEGLTSPADMFATANMLGQECSLSELMREVGVRKGLRLTDNPLLFVNTHPKEIVTADLVKSLHEIRAIAEKMPLVIEIHEAAITEKRQMQQLREALTELKMQLAYDDFGAGQARLNELVEFPPDYVKFDINLVSDIDAASPVRQEMLASLVGMVNRLGIASLAEGIETKAEAETCRQLGFGLGQGYFYGRPAPLVEPLEGRAQS